MSDVTGHRWTAPVEVRAEGNCQDPLYFDAVLRPHRSLSRPGFTLLMTTIGVASAAGAAPFLAAGAWPVLAFMSLNMILIFVAFRVSYRGARAYETLQLGQRDLVVQKIDADGSRRSWTLESYWLRIHMDEPVRHESQLILSAGGKRVIVGAFLTPDERLEVAEALTAALARRRAALAAF